MRKLISFDAMLIYTKYAKQYGMTPSEINELPISLILLDKELVKMIVREGKRNDKN